LKNGIFDGLRIGCRRRNGEERKDYEIHDGARPRISGFWECSHAWIVEGNPGEKQEGHTGSTAASAGFTPHGLSSVPSRKDRRVCR